MTNSVSAFQSVLLQLFAVAQIESVLMTPLAFQGSMLTSLGPT